MTYLNTSVNSVGAPTPPEDGTKSQVNKITWSSIKQNIFDRLVTAVEEVDFNNLIFFSGSESGVWINTAVTGDPTTSYFTAVTPEHSASTFHAIVQCEVYLHFDKTLGQGQARVALLDTEGTELSYQTVGMFGFDVVSQTTSVLRLPLTLMGKASARGVSGGSATDVQFGIKISGVTTTAIIRDVNYRFTEAPE